MKNIFIKIAITLFISLFIFVSMVFYYYNKRHETFHICSHSHEVRSYLFAKGRIGNENVYDVLKDAFNEDTSAIRTFASMNVSRVLNTWSEGSTSEKRWFCEQYRLSLHTLIDKIGEWRFVQYCKHLSPEKKSEIKQNITMDLKFDFDIDHHYKYKFVLDNL